MTFQKSCKILLLAVMFLGIAFSAFNFLSVKADAQAVHYKETKLKIILNQNGIILYDCSEPGRGCYTFIYKAPPPDPMPPQD